MDLSASVSVYITKYFIFLKLGINFNMYKRIKECIFVFFPLKMYNVEKEWKTDECKAHGPRSVNH